MKKRKLFLGILLTAAAISMTACDGPEPDDGNKSNDTGDNGNNGGQPSGGEVVVTQYTVTFNSNGGSAVSPITVDEGSKIARPTDPAKDETESTRYAFAGWYKDANFSEAFNFDTDTITSAITLYAKWEETNKFQVIFNSNGGTSVVSQIVANGEKLVKPKDPTKASTEDKTYTFAGWYKDANYLEAFNFDTDTITSATTLYAKWDEATREYTVTFVSNGDTETFTQTVEYGQSLEIPTAPTRTADQYYSYTFAAWSTSNFNNNNYDFSAPVTESFTLYGWWTPHAILYTITFDTNGGSNIASKELFIGDKIDAPLVVPTKQSTTDTTYTFAGWYKDQGLTTPFSFETETVTGDTTIYAKWTESQRLYTVSFDVDGGTAINSQSISYDGKVTKPADPSKDATNTLTYEFAGWYKDISLTTPFDFDKDTIKSATTIYAKWTEATRKYTVTFNSNGGTAIDPLSVEYGQVIASPTAPTKEASPYATYEFVGWYSNAGLTTIYDFNNPVTDNITLYAKWNMTLTVETENIGFGTSYTAFSTLLSSFTGKDDKNRPQLTTDLTTGNFTFRTKSVLDTNNTVLNIQGSTVDIVLPTQGSFSLTGTWGSSSTGKVYVYKVVGNTETLIYTSSTSYSSKDSVSVKFDSMSLEAGTYRIKGLKDSNSSDSPEASIVISQIYYQTIVSKVVVSFVSNTDQTIENVSVKEGTTLSAFPTLSPKPGFRFVGWYTTFDFQEGTEFSITDSINQDIVLYAKWEELSAEDIVTISFNTNVDGVAISSVDIEKGTKLTSLPELDIDGYRFNGWFIDVLLQNAFDINTYIFNEDATLYAEYIKTYNVTFLDKDGNLLKTVTVDEDAMVTESVSKPYVEGYKFDCWKIEGTDTEFDLAVDHVGENLVLRATYVVDTNPVAKMNISSTEGFEEAATIQFDTYKNSSNEYADNYNVYLNGTVFTNKLLTSDNLYMKTSSTSVTAELFGLKAGTYTVTVVPVYDESEITPAAQTATFAVEAYDRSGYAHFNNTEGVGAYNDDGTLKDNAIVLYVTDDNKNTVNLSFHDDVNNKDWSVTGIGNILNSAGKDNGSGTNSKGGTANTNGGVLLALAQNDIPLVVRFVGCVSDSGAYESKTIDPSSTYLIDGLTKWDSVDLGGSTGDAGHMARMQSGKNITFEGVGNDAIIDGWGFHLICETAYKDYAKNFEVRNLTFINTPEDAVGMEGQETESTQTITAAVERCWVHHNTFLAPSMSKTPAGQGDKKEGDGSCDFKRGRYFTCSYNYFENCHKTNLVGSGKTSVQYCITYHHNLWYQCASRQPLARKANIHYYNNFIIGTSDTVASLRADTFMFAESNYYLGCSRPVEYKAEGGTEGVCKAYQNNVIGCFNDYDATDVTNRETAISGTNCKDNATGISYNTFDTDPNLFYYDAINKKSDCNLTDANQARIDCVEQSGSRYRTKLNKCEYKTSTDITSTASSATISGATSLTFSKASGVIKVFTVTTPVTVTMAATAASGFDTGYLLKIDGSVVLELSSNDQTAVLAPGKYVIIGCIAFTPNGKNDKETTITKCVFEEYDSEEYYQQLIAEYQAAHDAIPSTINYTDEHYRLIKAAMDAYNALGTLQSQIDNYADVADAYTAYKTAGELYVVGLINQIELPVTASNSSPILNARAAYTALLKKVSDASISNYSILVEAESQMSELVVDIFLNAVNAIPSPIVYTTECENAILNAEAAYLSLDEDQVNDSSAKAAYQTLTQARTQYNNLAAVAEVDSLIDSASLSGTKTELKAVIDAYSSLTSAQQSLIADSSKYNSICAKYVDLLIDDIPSTITFSDIATVTAARTAYNSLTGAQKALVNNLSTLEAAEATVADLGIETLDSYSTTDFSSGWTITGTATTTSTGLTASLSVDNTVTLVSDFMMSSVSNVTIKANITDKSINYAVYTSTDGETWTEIYSGRPGSNNTVTDLTATVAISGPVYIKVVMTCTKPANNPKSGSLLAISINK